MGTHLSTEEEVVKYFNASNTIDFLNTTEKINTKNTLRHDYVNGTLILILSTGQVMNKTK